jgi:hypothetical protein
MAGNGATRRSPAQMALWRLHDEKRSWHKVASDLGCNPGLAWNVAHGRRRASRSLRMALGLIGPPKPRINWKKLYLQLTGAQTRAGVESQKEGP